MSLFGPPNAEKLKAKGDVKGLIKLLHYMADSSVRKDAVRALGEIGDARAVEPLVDMLRGGPRLDRWAAARALGQIGDARAVEPLIAALKDERRDTRYYAAMALGRLGDGRAVEPLIAALRDEEMTVREGAAEALDDLGWQPSRDEAGTIYLVAKGKWDECVAIGADAVGPLIAELEGRNPGRSSARKAAAMALGQIGDARAVEPLAAALNREESDLRRTAAAALGQIGDGRAVEPLVAALTHPDMSVREAASEALDQMGESAVEPLIAKLKDEKSIVRREAARALGQIGDARAIEPLIAALDGWYNERHAAAEALGQMGEPAVEPLIAKLKDKRSIVRVCAAMALGLIGDARAVEDLIRCLKGYPSEVAHAAGVALCRIGDPRAAAAVIDTMLRGVGQVEGPTNTWSPEVCQSLFGVYTHRVLGVAAGGRIIERDRETLAGGSETWRRVDTSGMMEALKVLCKIDTPVSTNVLHQVANGLPEDITYVKGEVSSAGGSVGDATVSFEPLREIARQELAKRGNPDYDPYEYEKEEAWEY